MVGGGLKMMIEANRSENLEILDQLKENSEELRVKGQKLKTLLRVT